MKRRFLKFGIPLLILGIFFALPNFATAQAVDVASWFITTPGGAEAIVAGAKTGINAMLGPVFTAIGYVITVLSSIVLIFAGFIYDTVINFTIVDMAKNLGGASELGKSISAAWATLRDIANMAFIFVLLYAAFRTMFNSNFSNFQGTIKNIIIVALLINFSLFFTKVAVDASNIVSLGFYRAIQSNNTTMTGGVGAAAGSASFSGISGGYMKMLGLQSWYDSNLLNYVFNAEKVITIAFISAAFMLIAAVIFLITGVMFAARFIILIFLMILSPLAVVAYAIPGQKQHFNKWVDSLKGQLLFPPLFFALTWVAFRLGNTLMTSTLSTSFSTNATWANTVVDPFKNTAETAALLLNFVLVIGFSIAALIFSKQVASKTMGFGKVSAGIGAAAIGTTAWAGRNTLGRGANWLSENKREEWSKSPMGRAGLWMADKTRSGSFDVGGIANTKFGKAVGTDKVLDSSIIGKAGGKGGFAKATEEKAKRKADYAKRVYGKTEAEKEREKELGDDYDKAKEADAENVKRRREESHTEAKETYDNNERRRQEYLDNKLKPDIDSLEEAKREQSEKEQKLEEERRLRGNNAPQVFALEKEVEAARARAKQASENLKNAERILEKEDDVYKELKDISDGSRQELKIALDKLSSKKIDDTEYSEDVRNIGKELSRVKNMGTDRQVAYAKRLKEWPGAGNKAAARAVRAVAEGKEKKDKKKLYKDLAKELGIEDQEEETIPEAARGTGESKQSKS